MLIYEALIQEAKLRGMPATKRYTDRRQCRWRLTARREQSQWRT